MQLVHTCASIQEFLAAAGVKTIPHRPYVPPVFKSFWRQGSRRFLTGPICRLCSRVSGGRGQDDSPPALFASSIQEYLAAAGVKTFTHRPCLPAQFRSFWRQGPRRFPTGPICRLCSGVSGGSRGQDDPPMAPFVGSIQEFLAAAGVKTIPHRPYLLSLLYSRVSGGGKGQDDLPLALLPPLIRSFWRRQGSRRFLTGPICQLYSGVSGSGRSKEDPPTALFVASIQEFLAAAGVKTIPNQPYLPALFRIFYRRRGQTILH
jgi:hypothetical protein